MNWDPIISFLKDQGPLIIALAYAYMNGKVIRSQQELKNLELQNKIREAHEKIDARFAGMSPNDVVNTIIGSGGTKSSSDGANGGQT